MTDKIPVLNAMDNPAHRELLEEMIGRMRGALAPMLIAAQNDSDQFQLTQGMMITAGAMFAGMTVGHMIGVGGMKEQDRRRAGQVVLTSFRSAIEIGKREARQAMLEQREPEGTA